jgi:hypothetical protein
MKKPFYPNVIILIFIILMGTGNVGIAQIHERKTTPPVFKQSIGIQFNPYLDQSFFNGDIKKYVFAIRYSWESKSGISFGPEFSGDYGHSDAFKWHVLKAGVFFRYTFLRSKKVSPFVEASGYYQWYVMTVTDPTKVYGNKDQVKGQKFGYYIAPGISIPLYKKKLMLDFFIKFSTDKFLNGRNFIPSIRIVWRF